MPDLRDRLEDLAAEFPERRGMDGLEHRKRRRQLHGRVLAGALALLIAAVGTASVFLAFDLRTSVAEQPQTLPDTLRIECDGQTVRVLTPTVRVRPDGVRIEVRNTATFDTWTVLSLSFSSEGSPHVPGGQTETTVTSSIVPGTGDVWCGPSRTDVNDGPVEDRVEIVDPEGVYRSLGLDCEGTTAVSGHFDFTAGAEGEPGPPTEIIKRRYEEILQPDDVVDYGGYPEGAGYGSIVRIVRADAVVATFQFSPGSNGTFLQSSYSACSEFNEELNRA